MQHNALNRITAALSATVLLAVGMQQALASNINFTPVFNSSQTFNSLALDPSTGKFYDYQNRGTESPFQNLYVYNNATDLSSGTSSSYTAIPFLGTYIAVNNGTLYAKANSNGGVQTWNALTGASSSAVTYFSGMNGNNGFNWGGYSGIAFMQDQRVFMFWEILRQTAATGLSTS